MTGMSRRDLLAAATAGGIYVMAPIPLAAARQRPGLLRGGNFSEGVQAGDPTADGITLLTRLADVEGRGQVLLEIARDRGFDRVVTRARLDTRASLGHAVKARVEGLEPHSRYWYRFAGRTAESIVGSFRTAAPPGSREPVRFGIFTGQDLSSGYFNAHARLADEDLDFVLNLGDYVCADEASDVRAPVSATPARTLAAYRRLYRGYRRRDGDLRRMHAAHAMLSCWDDREVAPGYAGGAAYGDVLQRAAYRAWFEAMPHYPKRRGSARIHHRPSFGRTLDIFVLDTRQYRVPNSLPSGRVGDLLGDRQAAGLRAGLRESRATWKLVATPSPITDPAAPAEPDLDGWPGYPAEREAILGSIAAERVRNVTFASGNRQRFTATDVRFGERAVATEFTCASVTQRTDPDDGSQHGYAIATATRDAFRISFCELATVRERSRSLARRDDYRVSSGRPGVVS